MTRERNEATLLLGRLYCVVTPKVVIGDVRPVAPNVPQELVRVLVLRRAFPSRSVVGGRLRDVDVRETRIIIADASHDLGKCGNRIRHPHACQINDDTFESFLSIQDEREGGGRSLDTLTLERRPRAEPYAHPVCANGLGDRADDLEHEPRAILHQAAICVRPAIRVRLHELVHEIPVRPVDLHAVEPGAQHGVLRRRREQPHVLADLLYRQRVRQRWRQRRGQRRGRGRVGLACGCEGKGNWARRDERVSAFSL